MSTDAPRLATHQVRTALADDAAGTPRRLQPGERFGTALWVLVGALALVLALGLAAALAGNHGAVVLGSVCAAALVVLAALAAWAHRELLAPMVALRRWAQSMCAGDLTTRVPPPPAGEFARLAFHVNRLSHALDRLANDMDDVVTNQTEHLRRQNQSINLLYEVAATLNEPGEVDDMLRNAARKLMDVVGAEAAVLRPVRGAGPGTEPLRVLAGFETGGVPAVDGEASPVLVGDAPRAGRAAELDYGSMAGGAEHVLRVPLRYRNRSIGAIDLFADRALDEAGEHAMLLASVGKHLGMAVEKARLDAEAQQVTRERERTSLAHELHDSLAQTIVGLRMQTGMLAETLAAGDAAAAGAELERIRGAVEEAHTELRELLANFHAPVDERGIMAALADLTDRARRDADRCAVHLQLEGDEPDLAPAVHLQVARIVGEALANARKHAAANAVRVLVANRGVRGVHVLVEDDGAGMHESTDDGLAGENLGLAIMRERAQRAGGTLAIDSEPGEGTRVALHLPAAPARRETG